MVSPLLRTDPGKADAKVEEMHVEHEHVVVRVVSPSMPGEAAACARHIGVKMLHGCCVLRRTMA